MTNSRFNLEDFSPLILWKMTVFISCGSVKWRAVWPINASESRADVILCNKPVGVSCTGDFTTTCTSTSTAAAWPASCWLPELHMMQVLKQVVKSLTHLTDEKPSLLHTHTCTQHGVYGESLQTQTSPDRPWASASSIMSHREAQCRPHICRWMIWLLIDTVSHNYLPRWWHFWFWKLLF